MIATAIFTSLRSIVLLSVAVTLPFSLSAQESTPVGKWKAAAETDQGTMNFHIIFSKSGGKLTGSIVNVNDGSKHDLKKVEHQGKSLKVEFDFEFDNQPLGIKIATQLEDEKQIGEWTAFDPSGNQVATGKISAERVAENGLVGKWNVTAETQNGSRDYQWTFKEKDGKILGVMVNEEDGSERELKKVKLTEDNLTFEVGFEVDNQPLLIKVDTKLADKKQEGTWAVHDGNGNEVAAGVLTAVRESKAVSLGGDWNTVATLPGGQTLESVLTLKEENKKLTGTLKSPENTSELDNIKQDGEAVRIEFTLEIQAETRDIVIEATLKSENELTGEWMLLSDSGEEEAYGDWSATRKQ